jgi:PAS domain S-box-containing protein
MPAAVPSTDADVESPREAYLRRVIERQPACLTRIASDGTFLAVNDAALSMLGAAELGAVLETSVLALVAPEHKDQCREFLARIIAGDRGSTEVDLTGLGGLRYTLQIHAVSLRSVDDSLASALCTFWDVTQHRRLERALTEAAARGEQQAALRESERRRNTLAQQHAAQRAQLAAEFRLAQQQFDHSLAEQRARITEAEAALHEAGVRERALLVERDRNQQTWSDALAHAAAEHARTSDALQASIRALESSLTQAKAREDELVARHGTETDQLERTLTQLEQQLRAAQAERNDAVARHDALREEYDAERATLARVATAAESARAEATEQLATAAADRRALETDLRRLAAAMANGLHDTLAAAAHRGRRALASVKPDSAYRPHADALLAGASETAAMARRIRQASSGAETDAAAGRLVQSLEGALRALLSPSIALSVFVGSSDTRVDLAPDQLEQLLMTLVANRRVTMISGGHVSIEVADVDLDQACARERGTSVGAHVLVAVHVSAPAVDSGLPAALFGASADENEWRAAGPGMAGLFQAVQAAGGHLWATREGDDTIAFELYLPSVTSGMPAASLEIPA